MTVKELKEKLDKLDDDLPIHVETLREGSELAGSYVLLQGFKRMNLNGRECVAVRITTGAQPVGN